MAYVDLGKKPSDTEKTSVSDKPYYPSVSLSDVPELDDLPDGIFKFEATGQVVRHSETIDADGERHCDCTIEIHSIEPKSVKSKEVDLGSALKEIESKKEDEGEVDESDDE
jgi:hypothetical protein